MSHLASVIPEEKWYMYEVSDSESKLRHYLIGKYKSDWEEKRRCIMWDEKNKGVKIGHPIEGDCEYSGSANDFERFKEDDGLEASVKASLQREDMPSERCLADMMDSTPSLYETIIFEVEAGTPRSYVAPNNVCEPKLFGVYGTQCPERVCQENHLVSAFRGMTGDDKENGKKFFMYLRLAYNNAGNWVSSLPTKPTRGGGATNWWGGVFTGIGFLLATAFLPK